MEIYVYFIMITLFMIVIIYDYYDYFILFFYPGVALR